MPSNSPVLERVARHLASLCSKVAATGLALMTIIIAWQVFAPIFDVVFTLALNVLYAGITSYG